MNLTTNFGSLVWTFQHYKYYVWFEKVGFVWVFLLKFSASFAANQTSLLLHQDTWRSYTVLFLFAPLLDAGLGLVFKAANGRVATEQVIWCVVCVFTKLCNSASVFRWNANVSSLKIWSGKTSTFFFLELGVFIRHTGLHFTDVRLNEISLKSYNQGRSSRVAKTLSNTFWLWIGFPLGSFI